jgi:hypothetical protein
MTDAKKQYLTAIALEEGYSEEEIERMLEMAELIFGDLL